MNKSERIIELERSEADRLRKEHEEHEMNPLARYSTSELKAELRRRKREY
jgi:hypothetical protein